jgi:hypothetical protein
MPSPDEYESPSETIWRSLEAASARPPVPIGAPIAAKSTAQAKDKQRFRKLGIESNH